MFDVLEIAPYVFDAVVAVAVVARLALAYPIVRGIALMFHSFAFLAEDIAESAFVQVIPVLGIMLLRARSAYGVTFRGAMYRHVGPRRALLTRNCVAAFICPLIGGR